MRTFIAAIGDHDNATLDTLVRERLAHDAPLHAARVVVQAPGGDAALLVEQLNGEWPQFERVIFVGSVARARPAGSVSAYRWSGETPNEAPDGAAAATQAFDSTLLTLKALADLPDEVIVVEIDPGDGDSAPHPDDVPPVSLDRAQTIVRRLATSAAAVTALPRSTLGGL